MSIADIRETDAAERDRLSAVTHWLKGIETPQPMKLFAIGILVMTCLCGSIYYAARADTPVSLPAQALR